MINSVNNKVKFDLDTFIQNELPITYNFFDGADNKEYRQDLEDLFKYVSENKDNMPFYTISKNAALNINEKSEQFYSAMCNSLDYMFNNDDFNIEFLQRFFGKTLVDHPYFLDYAKSTWDNDHPAIYGRFDLSVGLDGTINGVYEFNGDTPVMLFESVILQNNLVTQLGKEEQQSNEYYQKLKDNINKVLPKGNVCIVFDYNYIEDICTCETLKQILEDCGRDVFITNYKGLDYDLVNKTKPFSVNDIEVDNIFMLLPWEEMLYQDNFSMFRNYKQWSHNVKFLEPAWRWFMSNKGFMAYMTWLSENVEQFSYIKELEGFLPAYMDTVPHCEKGVKSVGKPITGRLSNNIIFLDKHAKVQYHSDGSYEDDTYVYQEFCPPSRVDGRNNFIVGTWLSPFYNKDETLMSESSTICIREFDKPILDIKNERFVPHIIV